MLELHIFKYVLTLLNSVLFFFIIYVDPLIYFFWLCWVFVAVRSLSLVAVSGVGGLLIVVASLLAEHRLQVRGLQ